MSNDWPNNATFWQDKRVTVTGGAGFLGSFVVEKLRERGAAPPAPNSGGEPVQRATELQRSRLSQKTSPP